MTPERFARLEELFAGATELQGAERARFVAEGTAGDAALRTELERLLAAAGTSLARVVKVTVYLVDLADFPAVNALYAKHFAAPFPARACVQVAALPKNARIELDAIVALE